MIATPYYGYSGIGSVPIVQTVGSSITTGLSTAAIATGGPTNPVGLAVTIAAGASALVTGLLSAFGVGVPDMNKIQASNDVNQIEPYLKQNIAWWATVPHTVANQQQGIAIFDAAWNQVLSACGNAALGSAGVNCIGDRQRGGKWDWFALYLDPIANSPTTDSGTVAGAISGDVSQVSGSLGISPTAGILLIGVVLLVIGMKDI